MFWLVAFWKTREVLGLMEKEGSKQKCSQHLLFPSTLTVGSYVKAPGPSLLSNNITNHMIMLCKYLGSLIL